MTTLYIRDVPVAVAEQLKMRAAAQGMSLNAYVGVELARIASRRSNAEIVAELRKLDRSGGPTTEDILAALAESRRHR